jgi:deoxyribodipyrimidine photo-lyase
MGVSIHWFRRDLRLTDNTALNLAVKNHTQIVPVYILSEWRHAHRWTGYPRQAFLCGCLASLDANLRTKGGRLIIRNGAAVKVLEMLAREAGADTLYFNRDPDPFGRATGQAVEAMGAQVGLKVIACQDHALHERDEVLTGEGRPYRVFTPYARAWSRLEKTAPGRAIREISTPTAIHSEALPTPQRWGLSGSTEILPSGEAAARKRMHAFLDGPIFRYAERRDLPAEEGTSRLSQDLRHGTISIRELYAKCKEAGQSAQRTTEKQSVATYINELIWREFYFQVLWHWPEVLNHEFQPEYRRLAWRARWRPEDEAAWKQDPLAREHFERWCAGRTGFPIVDAGMRQLLATGFIHNRVRMIVAMFFTKDLHLWWMHGESWFMRQLVDGEIASNNGGWQWSASTGTDAAPYFRIQNPWSQTRRFDSTGAYIKRWVPELRDVPPGRLSQPPSAGVSLASDYPAPMVDHAKARERTLALFQEAKSDG